MDEAIQQVSFERSRFGSYQNSLEHKNNNLMNYCENIEISISRIQDIDMAKEMSRLTRQNILQEAGLAMISQANIAFQSLMKLLN